ncbi:Aste57867_12218 [Aphanomyces stellatus]|uniref:Aste57867_12218 protein n=1 Tax=Aphanomyces stellatus TaxID=120398 RepID=A0A485KUZ0_9STRA|nr:hypothetical protein As57867_012173 [Aphanomyces stellatus]VFT89072.1 Aste57867_12218 [Aphanomyces stellatus]
MDLIVHVLEARNLIHGAYVLTKQTPYCTLKIAGQKQKTNVNMTEATNPHFNQEFEFHGVDPSDDFAIEIKDHHNNLPKVHLGRYGIKLENLTGDSLGHDKWFALKNINKPQVDAGDVRMRFELRSTKGEATSTAASVSPTHAVPVVAHPFASPTPAGEIDWTGYEELIKYKNHYIDPSLLGHVRHAPTDYMLAEICYLDGAHVMVKSSQVPAERQALVKEIIALSKIHCDKILPFVGFYIDGDGPHCVTVHHLANPSNLHDLLTRMGARFKFSDKLKCAINVAEALTYMHGKSMLHRGIKAQNVLLDKSKNALLSGFGSCRTRSYEHTLTSKVGDVQWSAPEMLSGGEYGEKVDVYSFGVFLTELETGKLPFDDELADCTLSMTDLSTSIVDGRLRPQPSAACPPAFKEVIDWCLQYDPSQRPHMKIVHERLCAIADKEP